MQNNRRCDVKSQNQGVERQLLAQNQAKTSNYPPKSQTLSRYRSKKETVEGTFINPNHR